MIKTNLRLTFWMFCTVIMLSSCANYRLNYAPEVQNWDLPLPDQPISHTFYLIGDAGNSKNGQVAPALRLLEKELRGAAQNSTVIFLGDNLYPNGMAPKSKEAERADDEFRLKAQLDPLQDFPGNIFFIPGNHDWYTYGIAGLKRQRNFIEDYLDRKDVWQPDCGCGDPREIELNDDLVLILLDSEWWLTDWEGEVEVNQHCDARSREIFKLLLEDALKSNREKNVIVAMHHPLFSKGPHGGAFTVRDHLFPLSKLNKHLLLPLPLIGSIYPFYRSSVGTSEDMANPKYQDLRSFIMDIAPKNGEFIFVSGHEHSLQYAEEDDQHFIVSGSGSKNSAARQGDEVQFAYGRQGFAELLVYQDGSIWVQFRAIKDEATARGSVVFRKKIKDALLVKNSTTPLVNKELLDQQSVTTTIIEDTPERNGLGKALWGEHYRRAYRSEVTFPVLRLDEFQGGLQPVKKGGGYQTNSLRLEAADGRQFTMRSVKKDPTRTLGNTLSRSSFIKNLYLDAFNSAHPMAALPIPPMAEAVGVYHTNPTLYFIPKQAALGIYNEDFGDELYLVEERPDGKAWRDMASFGYPKEIVSTSDVIEEIADHHDHRLDYPSIVRARLFDLVIGDWDRHDDQWRWAKVEKNDTVYYQPIPRDRDQAFSKYDGFIYNIVREASAPARPLRPYAEDQKKIHWSNYGCRYFDATFLAGASWEVWRQEIRHLQEHLTDEVIETAFQQNWPDTIYRLDAPSVMQILKARRDNLAEMARSYYEYHAKRVVLTGTDKRELFDIQSLPNGSTRVIIYDSNKEGEKQGKLYDRLFPYPETREIHLYGLENDDIFQFHGQGSRGSRIRIIGGLGHDVVKQFPGSGDRRARAIIYDAVEEKIDLPEQSGLRIKLSEDPKFNTYNRLSKDFEYDYASFFPNLGFNPDDGLLIGLAPVFVNYGFKKSPYADRHALNTKYAVGTSGFQFDYQGVFIEALGKGNLNLKAQLHTPLYTANFFGLGNNTENLEGELGAEYYRVRQRYISLMPSFTRQVKQALTYGFGPTFESYRIELTGDRFIDGQEAILNPDIVKGLEFLGFQMHVKIENLNDPVFPTRGLKLSSEVGWILSLDNSDRNFPYYEGALSIYQQIDTKGSLVFATQVGGKHLFNNKFEFFQGAVLGGQGPDSNFRGLRRERFTGRSAWYQNTDLRWKVIDSDNSFLPFSLGIFGGFDHGRVWLDQEISNTWHYSYGGGFWLSPLDLLDLKFSFFQADREQLRFMFGGNFFF